MAEFGLIKSFQIDDGQLDGMTPQQCFVLGYELAQVDEQGKGHIGFERPVHADNHERIEKSLKDAGRMFSFTWLEGDSSESWMDLRVSPR